MKNIVILLVLILVSCKSETKENEVLIENSVEEIASVETYKSFGEEISSNAAISNSELLTTYQIATTEDTLMVKSRVKVLDVCQAKGCWMIVDLGNEQTARVKFKDYGFFMPKDIKGKEVIINGKAFVNVMPVDELRHYAEDAGKSKEEVAKITEPKKTNSFLADGVLLVN